MPPRECVTKWIFSASPQARIARGMVSSASASIGWEGESGHGYAACDEQGRYGEAEVPVGEVDFEVWVMENFLPAGGEGSP